jgi:hypothetical protein
MAELANSLSGKSYTIRLYGSIGVSGSDSLSTTRAEKVKAELIAQGVPASNITIDPSKSLDDMAGTDTVSQQTARVVVMRLDPTCTDTGTGSNK